MILVIQMGLRGNLPFFIVMKALVAILLVLIKSTLQGEKQWRLAQNVQCGAPLP